VKRPGCTFRLDDVRADVLVERDGVSVRYREVPTLTCATCGLRLAWVPMVTGRVDAVHGLELDALVPGRVPRCGSLAGAPCPECGRLSTDPQPHKLRCGRREGAGLALSADRSAR